MNVICTYKYACYTNIFHVLSIFSCCLIPICHSILLETSFCNTRLFWINLVCSERCWVSIRKQVQITVSQLEPFTLKPQSIFAQTFWFSINDGLGIFKQVIQLSGLLSYASPEWKIILCKGRLEYKRFYTYFFLTLKPIHNNIKNGWWKA